jgi:hypothetical protein
METYTAPTMEKLGGFRESTRGLWFGKFRDVFGGKAIAQIVIYY